MKKKKVQINLNSKFMIIRTIKKKLRLKNVKLYEKNQN